MKRSKREDEDIVHAPRRRKHKNTFARECSRMCRKDRVLHRIVARRNGLKKHIDMLFDRAEKRHVKKAVEEQSTIGHLLSEM